jgi:uncharacterized protein
LAGRLPVLKMWLLPVLILASACGKPMSATQAAPHFPVLTGRVVDQAALLPADVEAKLSRASASVEREVGSQFVVVTVRDLEGRTIEDYSLRLGRAWGIGSEARNDGLLLIVARQEKKMRIEVGYGLEKRVSDAFAAKVLREAILPRFKAGDFPGGIEAGSAELVRRLRSKQTDREIAVEDRMSL